MESFDEKLAKECELIIVQKNMAELSRNNKEEFAKLRKNGFGASDSSIILGVNPYEKNWDKLIEQKNSKELTLEEIRVGALPQVKKGADLEPLILHKFEEWADVGLRKPDPMYRLKDVPQLTVNFDGVALLGGCYIPIEAKYVSSYAHKYWGLSKCLDTPFGGTNYKVGGKDVADHIKQISELIGIPPYYYTQVQHQLLALKAEFGYLTAIFDKDWTLRTYKIYKDDFVQCELIELSAQAWQKVIRARG